MDRNKSVIIIGAGIGGLTTGILLAKEGYKVDIYEKNPYPGGRCGRIVREGHRFDLGATILMMPSIYRNVFNALGIQFDESFELKELKTIYGIYFANGRKVIFSADSEIMKSQLELTEPGSYEKFRKYISKGYDFFTLSMTDLLGKNYYSLFEFITFRNMYLLVKLKTYLRHKTYVKKFFKNQELQQAFTFQNIYVGQSPLEAPALFTMLPAAELTEGALFPKGGMYSITEKLLSEAKSAGINIHFEKIAERVQVSGKKAESVFFTDGTTGTADIIIANADLPYVYKELLPKSYEAGRIAKMKYACSALVIHWGLKKAYPQLHHHSIFLSEEMEHSLEMIFRHHSLSANPSFYVHSPVRTDPTAAPEGEDSISVIVPMGHIYPGKEINWQELIKSTKTAVFKRLREAGVEDIEENIKFEICYTPSTWETIYHVSRGSVFGSLKHSIFQMGYFRPHNRHKKYKNLYFAGGSTHPGNGVPLVLMSAKLTAERIIKEN
jgi:phytoene desaturase